MPRLVERDAVATMSIGAILHFAGSIVVPESVVDPAQILWQQHREQSRDLVGGRRRLRRPKHFIFSSTAATYGVPEESPVRETTPTVPINPYGMSKLMTEIMLKDTRGGASDQLLRAALFQRRRRRSRNAAPGQATEGATHLIKVATEVVTGKRSHVSVFGTDYDTPDGTGVRDYIHVSDLAAAHVLALDAHWSPSRQRSHTLNCGYGRGFSVLEVLTAVEAVMRCTTIARQDGAATRGRSRCAGGRKRCHRRNVRLAAAATPGSTRSSRTPSPGSKASTSATQRPVSTPGHRCGGLHRLACQSAAARARRDGRSGSTISTIIIRSRSSETGSRRSRAEPGGDRFAFHRLDFLRPCRRSTPRWAVSTIDRIVHLGAQAGVRYSITNPRAYAASNLDRPPQYSRTGARAPGGAPGLCLLLVGLWHQPRPAVQRRAARRLPDLALRRHQEGGRADERSLRPSLPPSPDRASLLHRLRTVGPPRHGGVGLHRQDPRGRADRSCSTTAGCSAISPIIDDIVDGILATLDHPPVDDGIGQAGGQCQSRTPSTISATTARRRWKNSSR